MELIIMFVISVLAVSLQRSIYVFFLSFSPKTVRVGLYSRRPFFLPSRLGPNSGRAGLLRMGAQFQEDEEMSAPSAAPSGAAIAADTGADETDTLELAPTDLYEPELQAEIDKLVAKKNCSGRQYAISEIQCREICSALFVKANPHTSKPPKCSGQNRQQLIGMYVDNWRSWKAVKSGAHLESGAGGKRDGKSHRQLTPGDFPSRHLDRRTLKSLTEGLYGFDIDKPARGGNQITQEQGC